MTDKLYTILENKAFKELNDDEKVYLKSKNISGDEYAQLRSNIVSLRDAFDQGIDEIEIDNTLLLELKNNIQSPSLLFKKLLTAQVSLAKVAAIFVFTFIFYTLFLMSLRNNSIPEIATLKQSIIDSIPTETVTISTKTINKIHNMAPKYSNRDSIALAYIAKTALENSKSKKHHRLQNNKDVLFTNENDICLSEFGKIM